MDSLLLHTHTQESIKRLLTSMPHGIGIEGLSGSGKKHLSLYIAQQLLGVEDIRSHPYTKIIDSSKNLGIDEVREAISFLSLTIPGDAKYKRCLIFWSFEDLSIPAQNALLKSLEEPPSDSLIIITTSSKDNLLPTTVSRLSWLNVAPVDEASAMSFYANDFKSEQVKKAYLLSSGRIGLLHKLLNEDSNHELVESIEAVKKLLMMQRYERLAYIGQISKDKNFDIGLYLNSLAKILEAALINRLNKTGRLDRKLLADIKRILLAQKAEKYNANQKLLLTEIFYNI